MSDFTILMGLSSSGKTTIFRALQFLFYGEWDSTYANDPTKATGVAIEFANGTRVIRLRKDGINSAAIMKNGETVKYKSFGSVIPGLKSLINVTPVDVGNTSVNLNFSMQDDPIFMVSEPRPVKAQWLGRLYGAHVINEMLRSMSKDKKNSDSKRKDKELDIGRLTVELGSYSSLEEQESEIAKAEKMLAILNVLEVYHREKEQIDIMSAQLKKDSWVSSVDIDGIKTGLSELSSLRSLRESFSALKKEKNNLKSASVIIGLDLSAFKKEIGLLGELSSIRSDLNEMSALKKKYAKTLTSADWYIKGFKKQLTEELIKNNSCPACGQDATGREARILDSISKMTKADNA